MVAFVFGHEHAAVTIEAAGVDRAGFMAEYS